MSTERFLNYQIFDNLILNRDILIIRSLMVIISMYLINLFIFLPMKFCMLKKWCGAVPR